MPDILINWWLDGNIDSIRNIWVFVIEFVFLYNISERIENICFTFIIRLSFSVYKSANPKPTEWRQWMAKVSDLWIGVTCIEHKMNSSAPVLPFRCLYSELNSILLWLWLLVNGKTGRYSYKSNTFRWVHRMSAQN